MKKNLLLIIMLISCITGMGQEQISSREERPNIEVTGSAEIEVIPDEIFVSIVLREKSKNNDKWKIETQEDNLMKKLNENGFDPKNLSLSDAGGDLQYAVFRKNRVLTEKKLQMKLQHAGEVNKLFQILDALEIEEANISKTSHSQMERLRQETKIEAMKAARNKADYLLASIGEQTGKPLFIREQVYTSYPSNIYGSNSSLHELEKTGYAIRNQAKGFENEIGFTKIKIKYEIFARFGIK